MFVKKSIVLLKALPTLAQGFTEARLLALAELFISTVSKCTIWSCTSPKKFCIEMKSSFLGKMTTELLLNTKMSG